jgi:hypothetical protein
VRFALEKQGFGALAPLARRNGITTPVMRPHQRRARFQKNFSRATRDGIDRCAALHESFRALARRVHFLFDVAGHDADECRASCDAELGLKGGAR